MTVSAIIARARDLADITGAAYFSTSEEYAALNASYRDVYEQILASNDDFFITEWNFDMGDLTEDSIQKRAYFIDLPADFYRLRVLQYQSGENFRAFDKFAPQEEPQNGVSPSYRIRGTQIKLILPQLGSFTNFRGIYYPVPETYDSGTDDISFPPQLEPEILAYQIAMDIKRKQKGDYSQLGERRAELWERFAGAVKQRDNWKYESVNNVYQTTYTPWR